MNKKDIIKEVETNKVVRLNKTNQVSALSNQYIKDKIIKIKNKLVIIDRDVADI